MLPQRCDNINKSDVLLSMCRILVSTSFLHFGFEETGLFLASSLNLQTSADMLNLGEIIHINKVG